ncbi:MAG: hypothetical protein WDA65_00985 [Christensenellales bacterium]
MTRKRNKLLTVLFSLIPGAGHMFMGFMKHGVSVMSLFFLIILLSSWLGIGALLYVLPVLWFYSFFGSINIAWTDDTRFAEIEDRCLIATENFSNINSRLAGRGGIYLGILLLYFGVHLILSNTVSKLYYVLQPEIANMLSSIVHTIPQIFISAVIIIIGVKLIAGKKKELKKHD